MSDVTANAALPVIDDDVPYDDMVIVRDIAFDVVPLHELEGRQPFSGIAHIAYIPDGHTIGAPTLARIVDRCARRSPSEARLARDITRRVEEELRPRGVAVVVRATSPWIATQRGHARGATAITTSTTGLFRYDTAKRSEFLRIIGPAGPRR